MKNYQQLKPFLKTIMPSTSITFAMNSQASFLRLMTLNCQACMVKMSQWVTLIMCRKNKAFMLLMSL